jgi:acetolactate decarboxylase
MPQLVQHTLYQVSTSTALVEGIYEGAVRVGDLRRHGDLGRGTFDELDGEMVIVDGRFYQVRADGSVHEVENNVLSPFAAVTSFSPDASAMVEHCPDHYRDNHKLMEIVHPDALN